MPVPLFIPLQQVMLKEVWMNKEDKLMEKLLWRLECYRTSSRSSTEFGDAGPTESPHFTMLTLNGLARFLIENPNSKIPAF